MNPHRVYFLRQNEIEDIYQCTCGEFMRVPRGCDTPDCNAEVTNRLQQSYDDLTPEQSAMVWDGAW